MNEQLIVDTKRTFQMQDKKIKMGMLLVLKIYFKTYNHFEGREGS